MNKNLLIYLTFIGLFGLLFGCNKEATKVVMLATPNAPTISTLPGLTLQRANATDTLTFVGTPVDPGFQASASYVLEACASGTNFQDPVVVLTGTNDTKMKITVSDLNGLLLKKFPADAASSIDFQIVSTLVITAGTGYSPMVYTSAVKTASVTTYGLPRLDLVGSGITQKIESALGDGNYTGYVKLDATKPFTLSDPDNGTVYGANGTALAVNGGGITAAASGWYILSVSVSGLSFTLTPYMIGVIGDATPNGWNSPDTKMDYNSATGLWYKTLDLIVGSIKIRANDTWGSINLGLGDATHTQYSLTNLWNNGSSQNIPIATAGNYTIQVFIGTSTYSMTITKNN